MTREKEYRNKWALALTALTFVLVLAAFGFYKGFLPLGGGAAALTSSQKAAEEEAEREMIAKNTQKMPSPLQNSVQTISTAASEMKTVYDSFVGSLSSVLVPFISSIDVYNKE